MNVQIRTLKAEIATDLKAIAEIYAIEHGFSRVETDWYGSSAISFE